MIKIEAIRKAAGGPPPCDKHPNRPASCLYLDTGEALCRECREEQERNRQ